MNVLVILTKYFITIKCFLSFNSKDNGRNELDTCLCLTNVELNMRVGKVFGFTSEINVLVLLPMHLSLIPHVGEIFGTCAILILHGR